MTTLRGFALILGALGALLFAAPSFAADNAPRVQIGRTAFTPSTVTIAAGGSINWVNSDTIDHQLTASAAGLVSPNLTPTDSFGFTFPNAGTFTVTDKTGLTMSVTVTPAALVTVHVKLQPQSVVFGTWTKLLGNLDPGSAGQKVTVQQQMCGNQKFTTAKSVQTGTSGSFTAPIRPKSNTLYQVVVGSSKATIAVHVSPKLVLRKLVGGGWKLTVNGPATGSTVSIQTHSGSKWKVVQNVKVQGVSKVLGLHFKKGTMVRASMSTHQAGQCLDAGVSNSVIA
jgi:plastocyanin